jgi:hypothetical protein
LGIKNWFTKVDYTVVGSGIVGHAALGLREKYPESKILVLEKECYLMERALRMLVLPAFEVFLKL